MILIKHFNIEKYRILKQNFIKTKFICTLENDKIIIDTEDLNLINYINLNFEDYIDLELRLDAIEALIIGEQSTLSKIRDVLKI